MTEEKKPFTVSDRRHFTAEGEARVQAPEEAPPPEKKGDAERPRARGGAAASSASPRTDEYASDSLASERPAGEREREGFAPERAEDGAAPPVDFVGLLVSLAAQASFLMSPEPGSGAAPDLAGARSVIGLLEILKGKTEGRRTPDEDRVLDGLLYELRMAFVARTRAEKA